VTAEEAIAFIRRHGVVLEAGSGPVPSLVEVIVGTPVRGNWWSHPRGMEIFQLTRAVRASRQILVCRLVSGKVTFVHRTLWPALVRAAEHFSRSDLAQLREEHTSSGRHVVATIAFPDWAPASISTRAGKLSIESALDLLPAALLEQRRAT